MSNTATHLMAFSTWKTFCAAALLKAVMRFGAHCTCRLGSGANCRIDPIVLPCDIEAPCGPAVRVEFGGADQPASARAA